MRNKVDFKDNGNGTVTINGTVYSYDMFSEDAFGFSGMVGQVLKIIKKDDGVITVERLRQYESDNIDPR